MTLIAERLGDEPADRISALAGGARLAIPADLSHPCATGALERLVGNELAVLLVLHFGGQTVYVPTGKGSAPVDLGDVVRLTRAGKSARTIARRLACSDRTVYARRAEARQLGLLPGR